MISVGKRMHDSVIRNSETLHAPFICTLDQILTGSDGIQLTHLRMTVKLHSLIRRFVFSCCSKIRNKTYASHIADGDLFIINIRHRLACQLDKYLLFEFLEKIGKLIILHKDLDTYRILEISNREHHDRTVIYYTFCLDGQYLSPDGDIAYLILDINDRYGIVGYIPAVNDIGIIALLKVLLTFGELPAFSTRFILIRSTGIIASATGFFRRPVSLIRSLLALSIRLVKFSYNILDISYPGSRPSDVYVLRYRLLI